MLRNILVHNVSDLLGPAILAEVMMHIDSSHGFDLRQDFLTSLPKAKPHTRQTIQFRQTNCDSPII